MRVPAEAVALALQSWNGRLDVGGEQERFIAHLVAALAAPQPAEAVALLQAAKNHLYAVDRKAWCRCADGKPDRDPGDHDSDCKWVADVDKVGSLRVSIDHYLANLANQPAAEAGEAVRCRKCGATNIYTQYINGEDRLERRCGSCRYGWRDKPLDADPVAKPGLDAALNDLQRVMDNDEGAAEVFDAVRRVLNARLAAAEQEEGA